MSHPSEPGAPAGDKPPSTQEIPVAAPTGATAATSLPPHPDAAPPTPVAPAEPQPTGPVGFVPGLPGLGTPPVPPPAPTPAPAPPSAPQPVAPQSVAPQTAPAPVAEDAPGAAAPSWPETLEAEAPAATGHRHALRRVRGLDRTALLGLGLAALALVLVLVGVGLDFGTESYWSAVPLWSAFATLCAVLGLVAFAAIAAAGDRAGSSAPMERLAAAGLAGLSVFWLLVVLPHVDSDRGFVLTAALACLGGAFWIGSRRRD